VACRADAGLTQAHQLYAASEAERSTNTPVTCCTARGCISSCCSWAAHSLQPQRLQHLLSEVPCCDHLAHSIEVHQCVERQLSSATVCVCVCVCVCPKVPLCMFIVRTSLCIAYLHNIICFITVLPTCVNACESSLQQPVQAQTIRAPLVIVI
jgi:hypothetical protein